VRSLGLAAAWIAVACGDPAVVLEVRADGLEVPSDLDAFCLAVFDTDPAGGEFARTYRLGGGAGGVGALPQTLAVEPGSAAAAEVCARGYRRGVEVARDRRVVSFSGGVRDEALVLARCPAGSAEAPAVAGEQALPDGTRVAASYGRGGSLVVAVGPGGAALYRAGAGGLERVDAALPDVDAVAPRALVAFDADGDCDDDILVVRDGAPPVLWRRGPDQSFELASMAIPGVGAARAAVAVDLDGDGALDLVIGGEAGLAVLLNVGGRFDLLGRPIPGDLDDVTALAVGDLDGDGEVDLVVGRGQEVERPLGVLLGLGNGDFAAAPGALPAVALRTRSLAVADVDGDGFLDLVVGALGSPVRLYVNRSDGRLEDRSFLILPPHEPLDVTAVAAADWDGDCLVDLVIGARAGGVRSWLGSAGGAMREEEAPATGSITQVFFADLDDDGRRDAVAVDEDRGLLWLRR
jgi:hypothetical protein